MSQDSNITGGSDPKPGLQLRKPDGTPPAPTESPASANSGVLPRLSFAPKKHAEEPAPAQPVAESPAAPTAQPPLTSDAKGAQLKRPPPGTRLIASHELASPGAMPTPLTPVGGKTTAPFAAPKRARFRAQVPLWLVIFVLVLIIGGESYYILMQDEDLGGGSGRRPPLLIPGGPTTKPVVVTGQGADAPTPVYAYLQTLSPEIASGTDPRLFINSQMFHLGQVIAPDYGLKWIRIDDKTRELEFVDKHGQHYIKKF